MMITLTQQHQWLDGDVETPISLFLDKVGSAPGILLESAEIDGRWGRYSLLATDFLLILKCREGLADLEIADERLSALAAYDRAPFYTALRGILKDLHIQGPAYEFPAITRALYGYLGYETAALLEPSLKKRLDVGQSEAALALPGAIYLFDHSYNRLARLSLLEGEEAREEKAAEKSGGFKIGAVRNFPEEAEYQEQARRVKNLLRQGEGMQVVLSTSFEADFEGDPFSVYRKLRKINPSPYMCYLSLPGFQLLVSSPEVMVGCHENRLRLCPIAGTKPRGRDEKEDSIFETELVEDPKEQAEHVMLVDLGRGDLSRVAKAGSVEVERFMEVERFSHVMHLTSYLGADLAEGLDAVDILAASFPAGTLSGAPRFRAMEIIADMEKSPRGPYGGCMGWIGLDKASVNLDLGITIRSLWLRDGKVNWRAGAGLVLDSDPESEWRECLGKARAMLSALTNDN